MLYSFCIGLILIASVMLILAVLVQNPKSGMAANFGAANQVMGVRESTNILEKATWTLAGMIAVLSVIATVVMDDNLVSSSNSAIRQDANALMEKVNTTTADDVMPSLEIPSNEAPEAAPAEAE